MRLAYSTPNKYNSELTVLVYRSSDGAARIELVQGMVILEVRSALSFDELKETLHEWVEHPR